MKLINEYLEKIQTEGQRPINLDGCKNVCRSLFVNPESLEKCYKKVDEILGEE